MIKEINHIGIKSYRMDASIHFYETLLGGTIIRSSGSLDGRLRFVYIQVASGVVELITSVNESDQGYAHIAFLLAGKTLDAHYASIAARGLTFTVPPKGSSSGDGRLAFFMDPSGVLFELIERTESIRLPFAGEGKITAFDCICIETDAEPRDCAAFYAQELGLHGDAAGARFTLRSDCIALAGEGKPHIAYIAFRAGDPDTLHAELTAAGIRTEAARQGEGAYWITAPAGERILIL